jgi:hypothetical protein
MNRRGYWVMLDQHDYDLGLGGRVPIVLSPESTCIGEGCVCPEEDSIECCSSDEKDTIASV